MPNIKFKIFTNKVYRVIDDACLRQLKDIRKKSFIRATNLRFTMVYKCMDEISSHSTSRTSNFRQCHAATCPVDTSVMVHYSRQPPEQQRRFSRFSVEPSQFYFSGSFMFLHCSVAVCSDDQTNDSYET
ncbi:TGF-beta receptor type III, partial [Trichinella spiralis]|uniref:TGF-beta receptor type III n=1 Tax=Trichinella spiralis TaxID=6334 RepID=UPI0001EFD226